MFHVKHRIGRLVPGDEAALETFLRTRPDSSMFLRSNVRSAGLVDRGEPYQGTYVASFEHDSIIGVVAHCWNGMLLVQAPGSAGLLVQRAVEESGRAILGLSGPGDQVSEAKVALGLAKAATMTDSRDHLFAVDLGALQVPDALGNSSVIVRRPDGAELPRLAEWSIAFHREALGFVDGPELHRNCTDQIDRLQEEGAQFVLVVDGVPVAYA